MRFIIFVIDDGPVSAGAGDEAQAAEIARRASLACNRKVELRAYLG